jgi:hypothetical protein
VVEWMMVIFLVKKLVRRFGNGRRRSQHSDIRIFFFKNEESRDLNSGRSDGEREWSGGCGF